jgi:predicted nucleic acid-binding protein
LPRTPRRPDLGHRAVGRAAYLVTGDAPLQRLGAYQAVTIVSPRAFLERLAADPGR